MRDFLLSSQFKGNLNTLMNYPAPTSPLQKKENQNTNPTFCLNKKGLAEIEMSENKYLQWVLSLSLSRCIYGVQYLGCPTTQWEQTQCNRGGWQRAWGQWIAEEFHRITEMHKICWAGKDLQGP